MKRIDLLRYLEANGCILLREGGEHSVYCNPKMRQTSTVPRHNEIKNPTAARIC
jgi:mRNA interferase HicA